MRKIRVALAVLVVTSTATAAGPAFVQITNGLQNAPDAGPANKKFVAFTSSDDATPGAPGNADGSVETYLLDVKTNAITQITSLDAGGIAAPLDWLPDGRLLLRANENIATTGPGPTAAGFCLYVHSPGRVGAAGTTTLVSPQLNFGGGSFNVHVAPDGKTWYLDAIADLVGENADQSPEVFAFDVATKSLRQITHGNGPGASSALLGFLDKGRRALISSTDDLSGEGTNVAGTAAAFVVDLKTSAAEQITPGDVGISGAKIDSTGRRIAFSFIVHVGPAFHFDWKVYDRRTKTLTPATRDGSLTFVPGSSLVVLNTREDLVPSATPGQGNADRSLEIFTMDLKTGAVVQRTATNQDTFLERVGANASAPVIVSSYGDLAPGAPGNGGENKQTYLVSVAARPKPTVQLTAFPLAPTFDFVAGGLVVFASYVYDADVGADYRGIFVVNMKGAPHVVQITPGFGTTFTWGGPSPDGRTLFLASTGDLAPGAPGNADGSEELYRTRIR
jgi:hypothetical protein